MKKLLIVMPSMEGGGAERVVSHLCHLWESESDLEVHLALIYPQHEMVYSLPEYVKVHSLNCHRVLTSFWSCYELILEIQPEVVFSSMSNVNMLLLAIKWWRPQLRVVIRENNLPSVNLKVDNLKIFRDLAYKLLYPLATKIICQSEAMRLDFVQHYPRLQSKLEVVPNPVRLKPQSFASPFTEIAGGLHLVVVGRLSFQKNCHRVIEIFQSWKSDIPEAHLWFLGEGEDRESLRLLCENSGLKERVHFPGFVKNIEAWLSHADLFLMCSRFEGSPNALLEALSLNCPVLVEAHPGGTKELMDLYGQQDRYLDKIGAFEEHFLQKPQISTGQQQRESNNLKIAAQFLNSFWPRENQ